MWRVGVGRAAPAPRAAHQAFSPARFAIRRHEVERADPAAHRAVAHRVRARRVQATIPPRVQNVPLEGSGGSNRPCCGRPRPARGRDGRAGARRPRVGVDGRRGREPAGEIHHHAASDVAAGHPAARPRGMSGVASRGPSAPRPRGRRCRGHGDGAGMTRKTPAAFGVARARGVIGAERAAEARGGRHGGKLTARFSA